MIEQSSAVDPGNGGTRRRRTLLAALVVGCVIAAAVWAVYRQRSAFVSALQEMGWRAMVASLLFGAAGTGATFGVWQAVLHGLGVRVPIRFASRVFFVSQLGKYLPGSVWPVVMQMEAGRSRGASRSTMLAANLISLAIGCAVGLLIAAVLLPFTSSAALARYWWLLVALPFLLVSVYPSVIPWALDRLLRVLRRPPLAERLSGGDSLRAAGWSALSFVGLGLHVAVLAFAMGHRSPATIALCVGGISLAIVAGVLFIPAPAGAGIRDVVLTLVLTSILSSAQALAVVVASRAILITADLLLAAVSAAVGTNRSPEQRGSLRPARWR